MPQMVARLKSAASVIAGHGTARSLRTAIVTSMKAHRYDEIQANMAGSFAELKELRGGMQVNVNVHPLKQITLAQWQDRLDAAISQIERQIEETGALIQEIKAAILVSKQADDGG